MLMSSTDLMQRLRQLEAELRDAQARHSQQTSALRAQMQRARQGDLAASRSEMEQLTALWDQVC